MKEFVVTILWWFFVLAVNGWINVWVYNNWVLKRREMRFLKHLRIKYPNADISLTTIATSDHKAMAMLKEQLEKNDATTVPSAMES